jgi:hypothetical protein
VIVSRKIRASGTHLIEKHDFEVVLEFGCHETPHVLVAAKAVGKNHNPFAVTADLDVIPD